jgi:hypothetical protein
MLRQPARVLGDASRLVLRTHDASYASQTQKRRQHRRLCSFAQVVGGASVEVDVPLDSFASRFNMDGQNMCACPHPCTPGALFFVGSLRLGQAAVSRRGC